MAFEAGFLRQADPTLRVRRVPGRLSGHDMLLSTVTSTVRCLMFAMHNLRFFHGLMKRLSCNSILFTREPSCPLVWSRILKLSIQYAHFDIYFFCQIWPVSHKIKTFEISRESGSLNFAISKCFKPFCVRSFIAQFPKYFQPTVSIYLLPGFLNCPLEDVAEVDTQRLRTMDFYGGEARWKRKNSRNCAPFRNCSIEYNI